MTDISIGRRTALKNVQPQPDTHPGLWLDRYLARQTWRSKDPAPPQGYDQDSARRAKDDIIQAVTQKPVGRGYDRALAAWCKGLDRQRHHVVYAECQTQGRVIIGLGAKGAGEFGISLHHTWGVPILPGSSLKGIAAVGADRYLEGEQWRRRPDTDQARPGAPTAFDALFGDVEEQGAVIFHDAWFVPAASDNQENGLHQDVLTVHHPAYYQGDAEPSDTEDPIPVPFVSASGTFLVALELHPSLDPTEHGHWLMAAWAALREGLERHGLGSKTNAGYGRVALPHWRDTSIAQLKQREAELRQQEERKQQLEQERVRRQTERPGMTPLERAQDVLVPGKEGADALSRWLITGGEHSIVGLAATKDQVTAVTVALYQAGLSRGLLKRAKDDWRPLIRAAIDAEWERSQPGQQASEGHPGSLQPGELDAMISDCTHKKKGIQHNKLAAKLAALGLDAQSRAQAITRLQQLGAQPGHLKKLQD